MTMWDSCLQTVVKAGKGPHSPTLSQIALLLVTKSVGTCRAFIRIVKLKSISKHERLLRRIIIEKKYPPFIFFAKVAFLSFMEQVLFLHTEEWSRELRGGDGFPLVPEIHEKRKSDL